MTDAYIREGIALANSRRETEERVRKAQEYSESCHCYDDFWENVVGIIGIAVTVGAWAYIFAHLL